MKRKVSFIEQRIVGLETGDIDAGYVNEEMIPTNDGSYYGANINSHRGLANATETREPSDSEVVDIDMPPEEIDMAFAEYEETEYTIDDFRKEYSLYPTEQMEKDLAERVAKIREELKSKKKEAVKTRELVLDADGNVTSVSSEHYVSPLEDYWDNIRKLSKYKERRKGVSIVHESGYVPTLYSNGSAVLLDAFGIGLGVKFIITNRPIGRNSTAGMYFPGTNYILLRDMPHRTPIS